MRKASTKKREFQIKHEETAEKIKRRWNETKRKMELKEIIKSWIIFDRIIFKR
jgi:hypothetical protein